MKELTDLAKFISCILAIALIVAAWEQVKSFAIALFSVAIYFAIGAGLILLGYGLLLLYQKWVEANTLTPANELGEFPARIKRNGEIIHPEPYQKPQGAKVSSLHYHTVNRELPAPKQEQEGIDRPPLLLPGQNLSDKIDLLEALNGLRLNPNTLEIYFGESEDGPIIYKFGPLTLHIGDLGRTGSGKSSHILSIIFQLILHDPQARRIWLHVIDYIGNTAKPLKAAPHLKAHAEDNFEAGKLIRYLFHNMNVRAKMTPAALEQEPILVLVLEEFLDIKATLLPEEWQMLERLFTRGRHARIYIIGMSHSFYSDEQCKTLRGQFATRSAFRVEDKGTLSSFGFDDKEKIKALMGGRSIPGRFIHKGENGQILAQSPYILDSDINRYFNTVYGGWSAPQESSTKGVSRPGDIPDNEPIEGEVRTLTVNRESVSFNPELNRAKEAWLSGSRSRRSLAQALKISEDRASKLIEEMARLGWIKKNAPRYRKVDN